MAGREDADLIGCLGRVTSTGAILPRRTGEVLVLVGGRREAFLARDADGGAIDAGEEVAVVDRIGPRTVLVTRLRDREAGPPITEEPYR